ncbi:tyrosine-type recombinase/integrase [Sphingomonas mollis]|uniref:Site-specific integrase n=1 Tax=Sphingomonas mollis TaxID=2795726 RepID=A0ABS0XSF5_9SPHN|nr:site-specific integrase [Sphingomonas sp. BT553]MBJ6122944.1 site-specific integrase [Sphingomonas sp. BT553]
MPAGQPRSRATKNVGSKRHELGAYWLWYRADRDDWAICWYVDGTDGRGRRTCRKSLGIGGGNTGQPPKAAQDALAEHYLSNQKPVEAPIAQVYVEKLMADWLIEHAQPNLADPVRYANGVAHWLQFFAEERSAGRLSGPPTVADINSALVERFHAWRVQQGVSGHTIARDTAALRQPLNWAWKRNMIASAPFVPDVKNKGEPRDVVYSVEQVAQLLEAAWSLRDRQHIHMFAMIMLSTNARVEAVLDLDKDKQVRDGLIHFNAPGRQQTKKRRSIVPICPTLAPWLELYQGRAIQWQKRHVDRDTGEPWFEYLPTDSIKNAFNKTLVAAGICQQALDGDGKPVWLPPRHKLGETVPRPKLIGLGSPNTLRHTTSTEMHRRGVPEAQIETAAGHRGTGTNNRHYRHLRPEYLTQFIDGVESFWADVGKLTKAHLLDHNRAKIFHLMV